VDGAERKPRQWQRLAATLREETVGIHPRLIALSALARALPRGRASQARARLFAAAGFRIGAGTSFAGTPRINGGARLFSNLSIGKDCTIDDNCVFDASEPITIGERVTLGPGVMILTHTPELNDRQQPASTRAVAPVVIGDGARLGARCLILPGVKVGAGAVVNAGAIVQQDVAPSTRVGGIPAVQLEQPGSLERSTS